MACGPSLPWGRDQGRLLTEPPFLVLLSRER